MNASSNFIAGVIGSGSFGTTVANLIAENGPVLLLARRQEVADKIRNTRRHRNWEIHDRVEVTTDLTELAQRCPMIFPVVPSQAFGRLLDDLAPHLTPAHILIHGTKGFDVTLSESCPIEDVEKLARTDVRTMSELIHERTVVRRIGCVAGPNLAAEIARGHPTATVVASRFEEVIREGSAALRSSRFRVHGSNDLLGVELAGVLKNVMAIVAGVASGLKFGDNTLGLLITRGLAEIATIAKEIFGADPRTFLGLAGVGDLVATCNSTYSRNHSLGERLARGESLDTIRQNMDEVAEGVKTTCIVRALAQQYRVSAPITLALHRVMFGDMEVDRALRLLMEFPYTEDVTYI